MRILTGMRVTGKLHFGHYFGTLQNWKLLQYEHECYFGLMDWHGMTSAYKKSEEIFPMALDMFASYLAWGIDPNKSPIFLQSWVPEHLELFIIFANMTPMGWLERVPTWKDAIEEAQASDSHNLGRFAYPVLQAADIALYKGQKVPIGQDQVAHLELTREIIRRFNKLYKSKLPEPTPLLTETPLVPGLDGRKMSKSYNNGLELEEESKSLQKKIKGMPTDPARIRREDVGNPEVCGVYKFHQLFSTQEDLQWVQTGCRTAGIGCGDCKGRLIERMESMIAEPREKKKELLNNKNQLVSMLQEGSRRAAIEAQKNLREIKEAMGLKGILS